MFLDTIIQRAATSAFGPLRVASALAAALAALALAPTAQANPTPYWGMINTLTAPRTATAYGNDCTMAIGSHYNADQFGPSGLAKAAGTFVCDGSRRHNLQVRVEYYAWTGSSWYLDSASSWTTWSNVLYGMGQRTLLSPPSCAPSFVPVTTTWLARINFVIDGNHRYLDASGVWPGGPNRC